MFNLCLISLAVTIHSVSIQPVASVISATRESVIQQQIKDLMSKLANKTFGMLTNPTSIDSQQRLLFNRVLDLSKKYNATLKCFFAPEHGLRGDQQAGSGDQDYIDAETQLPVYSLYGSRLAPTSSQLKGLDALLYDIQDVGSRFYTYIWTLTYTIESLSKSNVELLIFDRPNPLGRVIEGCPLKIQAGLIGRLLPGQTISIPQRYGLTIGEFISYLRPYLPVFKLSIIRMNTVYEIKQFEWVMSSPNMPTLSTVLIYPGMGIIEATTVSEGRGTTKPFSLSGIPRISARDLTSYFQQRNISLAGCILREAYFIPTFSKHTNDVCAGIQIHVTDPSTYKSVQTALHLLKAYIATVKDGSLIISVNADKLFGRLGFHVEIGLLEVKDILNQCENDLQIYKRQSAKYWIYI